jgi:hypothetical protein
VFIVDILVSPYQLSSVGLMLTNITKKHTSQLLGKSVGREFSNGVTMNAVRKALAFGVYTFIQ